MWYKINVHIFWYFPLSFFFIISLFSKKEKKRKIAVIYKSQNKKSKHSPHQGCCFFFFPFFRIGWTQQMRVLLLTCLIFIFFSSLSTCGLEWCKWKLIVRSAVWQMVEKSDRKFASSDLKSEEKTVFMCTQTAWFLFAPFKYLSCHQQGRNDILHHVNHVTFFPHYWKRFFFSHHNSK